MSDQELKVPSARECMAEAYRLMRNHADTEAAKVWLDMARELREDFVTRKVWVNEPAVKPAPTLHDVDGVVCAHGKVAVHWKDNDSDWWLHVKGGTSCDDPDQGGDIFRRRDQAMRERQDDPALGTMAGAERPDDGQRMEDDPTEFVVQDAATIVRPFIDRVSWDRATGTSPLDDTAITPIRLPEQPVEGQLAKCRNHEEYNTLVYQLGQWRHTSSMQALCPIPNQTIEGDESYHRFANPA